MAITLYIFILLTFFHLFFQNIIRNLFLSLEQSKLYDLELKLHEFKDRNTISPALYLGFKILFKASQDLLSSEIGIETYLAMHKSSKSTDGDNNLQALFVRNRNFEVAALYLEWEKIMKDAVRINYYAWYIYLFPLVGFRLIKKIATRGQSQYFEFWLSNIAITPDLYQSPN